jgi:adenylosuccinate synthase
VLDGLEQIRVAVGYRCDGRVQQSPPLTSEGFADCQPVYEDLPGWQETTVGVTRYDELPRNARRYLERLQEIVGVPIDLVSTGPERDQTIVLRHPFD